MVSVNYARYLEAKASVDHRALNRRVSEAYVIGVNSITTKGPIRILDIGAGTGNTIFRLIEKYSHPLIKYYVVDISHEHLVGLVQKLKEWARQKGYEIEVGDLLVIKSPATRYEFYIIESDIQEYLSQSSLGLFDVVIGQAVLDLFRLDTIVSQLINAVQPKGYIYLPITFDGMTTFIPSFENETDHLVEDIYHDSMGKDGQVYRSQTGRQVLASLHLKGINIVDVGSSDWIVMPDHASTYRDDEQYFLSEILNCVERELLHSDRISKSLAKRWITYRRNQLQYGQLIYIAHQLDLLVRKNQLV